MVLFLSVLRILTNQKQLQLAETLWKSLFESGNEEQARMLSKAMIEQGCQEVEVGDSSLILMFWKDYMEENNILTFRPDDEELH